MTQKRLFIIDTMAMAFRNYHAFGHNQLKNSKGLPTSVVFGCLNFILKLIEDEKPDYLVCATDCREKTFRHELFTAYKANRTEMPEDLALQLPYLYEMLDLINCKLLKVPGLEADDLIGSLVTQYASSELQCFIVSGDKDFMQLINNNILLYSPQKGAEAKIIDAAGVHKKFGCGPHQVIDILAIMGDSSDNIPGVKGVGEKGAQTLIEKYGSLEEVYQHLGEIANKRQREALTSEREIAFLSQKLVTIKTDAHLDFSLNELSYSAEEALSSSHLIKFCQKMELRSIVTKLEKIKKSQQSSREFSHNNPNHALLVTEQAFENYKVILTLPELEQLIARLALADFFCFDTETTGLDIINDAPIGISFAVTTKEAFYVPLVPEHTSLECSTIVSALQPIFKNLEKIKIGHNCKFDIQMLRNIGINVEGPFYDTMIMAHLIESTTRNLGLDACCLRYLNYTKISISMLIDKKAKAPMLQVPLESLTRYACEDADLTLRLYMHLFPILKEKELIPVAEKIEMPLIKILAEMEQSGIFVDRSILQNLSIELTEISIQLTREIYELAGEEFNINSPKQLAVILFEKLKIHTQLGITRIKKTQSGYSTDVSVLEQLSEHPLAEKLLQYRSVTKLKNTYVDALPEMINDKTGRIHTSFHQTGTATGRLSSSDPNLQNIPIRTEQGREIRMAFRAPSPNKCILSADYSQIELRILAHLAQEPALIEAFLAGEDIHQSTAAKIFEIPQDQVSKEQRSAAKAINFGIIYGMGPHRLARETGMSTAKAKTFIEKYFATYPGIESYINNSIAFANTHEYTKTISGRRRALPEIKSTNKLEAAGAQNIATNSPIQGSAAELIKIAMIQLNEKLKSSALDIKMLLQVHDELVFECPIEHLENARNFIKSTMESAISMDVPLIVEVGSGVNWLDAH